MSTGMENGLHEHDRARAQWSGKEILKGQEEPPAETLDCHCHLQSCTTGKMDRKDSDCNAKVRQDEEVSCKEELVDTNNYHYARQSKKPSGKDELADGGSDPQSTNENKITSEIEAKSQCTQTDTMSVDGVGFQPTPSIAEYVQNFGLTHFLDTASYNEYGEKVNYFKCSLCPYQTRLKKTLTTHIRTHTGEKPFKCTYCPFRTAQRTHLTMHLRTHTGERPFKCTECSFSSASGSDLKRHHRIHTGEKPYKCEICSYVASQKSYLTVHYRTHTGVKPYKCNLCSFSSARRYHLTTHLRTHTGEKPYKCAVCPFATAKSSHLRRHEKIHAVKKEGEKCS